jgi:lysine 6-dehydrogenase
MRVLVLGGGLMGPAAFNAMSDPDVSRVLICDREQGQLDCSMRRLAGLEGADKVSTALLDLNDQTAAARLLSGFDVAVGALPGSVSVLAMRAAIEAGTPFVDLALLDRSDLAELARQAESCGVCIILGCGLEPGLTEIMARFLAEKLDRVDELHICCGGIPEKPAPPLGYKIVFGGRHLPLYESDALLVRDGQLQPVARYSGVESLVFPGVGECEAWHEGFIPWLMKLPALKGLRIGTQKTVRWPGYAARVTVLKEMGLLSQKPIAVDADIDPNRLPDRPRSTSAASESMPAAPGLRVSPKALLDALLYPRVRLEEGERDITLFRVEAVGQKAGRLRRCRVEMVDRTDEVRGFTSMARTTAFTGAIVARMIARGDLRATGMRTPEQVIVGPLFDRLVDELACLGICFDFTEEKVETLGSER